MILHDNLSISSFFISKMGADKTSMGVGGGGGEMVTSKEKVSSLQGPHYRALTSKEKKRSTLTCMTWQAKNPKQNKFLMGWGGGVALALCAPLPPPPPTPPPPPPNLVLLLILVPKRYLGLVSLENVCYGYAKIKLSWFFLPNYIRHEWTLLK